MNVRLLEVKTSSANVLSCQLPRLSRFSCKTHLFAKFLEKYKVNSEPHHHHHVPGDRHQRKDNYDIHTLESAFDFVANYIESEEEYKP